MSGYNVHETIYKKGLDGWSLEQVYRKQRDHIGHVVNMFEILEVFLLNFFIYLRKTKCDYKHNKTL